MIVSLAFSLVISIPAAAAKEEPPAKKELFAKEEWYKEEKGKEQDFVGVLQHFPRKGGIGFGRNNPYRLLMNLKGKKDVREVYVGAMPELLKPYIGKTLKLTGKAVDMEVEGNFHREIWPARLEVVRAARKDGKAEPKKIDKVIAQGRWAFAKVDAEIQDKGKQFVLRSAAELVAATPYNNLDALPAVVEKSATDALAQALKVKTIDWNKQMLVVITAGTQRSGGFRIELANIKVAEKTMTITWKLHPPKGAATNALTHPAQVYLVEQFKGEVKFVR